MQLRTVMLRVYALLRLEPVSNMCYAFIQMIQNENIGLVFYFRLVGGSEINDMPLIVNITLNLVYKKIKVEIVFQQAKIVNV